MGFVSHGISVGLETSGTGFHGRLDGFPEDARQQRALPAQCPTLFGSFPGSAVASASDGDSHHPMATPSQTSGSTFGSTL